MAGGQTLIENQDYVIDYNLGTVRILNQAILTSGIPVNVQFENNATYSVQQKNYRGYDWITWPAKNSALVAHWYG